MSDWNFLEKHRATRPGEFVPPQYVSDSSYGFNGLFRFIVDGQMVRCIAGDGNIEDCGPRWQHVSVSVEGDRRPPRWSVMCQVKDLFWEPEDVVVQYHPARSEYVNLAVNCLHLWRPLDEKLPVPPSIMVGPKTAKKYSCAPTEDGV